MDWKAEVIVNAFRSMGYEITWADLMNLDSDGNENYNVVLQTLSAPKESVMGWNSAGGIFDSVAERLLQGVAEGEATETVAVETLAVLARVLRDGDWDVEDESLQQFNGSRIVESALRAAGWVPRDDD